MKYLIVVFVLVLATPSMAQWSSDNFFEKMQRDSEMDRLRSEQEQMRHDIEKQRIEQRNEAEQLRNEQRRMNDQLRNDLDRYSR